MGTGGGERARRGGECGRGWMGGRAGEKRYTGSRAKASPTVENTLRAASLLLLPVPFTPALAAVERRPWLPEYLLPVRLAAELRAGAGAVLGRQSREVADLQDRQREREGINGSGEAGGAEKMAKKDSKRNGGQRKKGGSQR